jgi:NAD(P)-dependent dehydrogenase (short-subunit alcohol dehydrogenase family)
LRAFGRLDIFVGNAGIFDVYEKIADIDEETLGRAFDELFAVNVKAYLLGVKAAAAALTQSRGSVLMTASMSSTHAGIGGVVYTASKHAVVGLMRTAAKEAAARGIRVNTLHPGPVDNAFQHRIEVSATGQDEARAAELFEEHIPLRRHASPDEIARTVLFLASDDSSFMTGATVATDGGMSI